MKSKRLACCILAAAILTGGIGCTALSAAAVDPDSSGYSQNIPGIHIFSDEQREFYGLERLTEALNRPEASGPDEILAAVKADVERFAHGTEQSDDLTMLCIRYRS